MDGRTLWPKSIGAQGKDTHSQAESCSYMRDSKCRERVSWIFCCFLIFLTGVRNSRWMKNALISYYTTWYANSLTFALIGAHQLTITAHHFSNIYFCAKLTGWFTPPPLPATPELFARRGPRAYLGNHRSYGDAKKRLLLVLASLAKAARNISCNLTGWIVVLIFLI